MDENVINIAKHDNRVIMQNLLNKRINIFTTISGITNLKGIIIYCHGLGSNKNWATRFYNKLLTKNIGIMAFDFPGHGNDNTNFSKFNLDLCIDYLNEVINYVTNKYNVPIYLFGSSFGGYVILNRFLYKNNDIKHTVLMCPAINFCEIMENKVGISSNYFDNNEYLPLYNNIKIYKNTYNGFKTSDQKIQNFKFDNISIIQGTLDKTVLYKDIKKFCTKNNLKLYTIEEGKHELYGYDDKIVDFIISIILNCK